MKKIFIILSIVLCYTKASAQMKIDKIHIYKTFVKGGTYNSILSVFRNPIVWKRDSTQHPKNDLLSPELLTKFFLNSKITNLVPPKIGGIELAGIFYQNTTPHYFIICIPNTIVDLTFKKTYHVNEYELFKKTLDDMK